MLSKHEVSPGGAASHPQDVHHLSLPADYVVDCHKQLVVVKFGKRVTVVDIQRYTVLLRVDPMCKPGFSEIVDLSEVEQLDLQADDFLRLADEIDPFSNDAKRAFIVQNAGQGHAVRMHRALRPQANIRSFGSFQEAERWACE